MRSSDNVLRGGLTPKHVDVAELLAVLDFRPGPVPWLHPQRPAAGVTVWDAGVREFRLMRIEGVGAVGIGGPAIALCTAGRVTVSGARGTIALAAGEAAFVSPDERELRAEGGTVFIATTGEG
jgi:mannose-6-phosphate isomerase